MGVPEGFIMNRGRFPAGRLDLITDVPGVSVGHVTLSDGVVQTGVTAVIPARGSLFYDKLPAAAHVINGFGKSAGLIQIQELGNIETPLLLTNTFAVGTASTALIRYMLERHPDIGAKTGTVNPVVLECNDGKLNDIRGLHITEEHVLAALERASEAAEPLTFEEGAVGAGTGMRCYELKGGIGSASRILCIGDTAYTLGALVLTNCGRLPELVISGRRVGEEISRRLGRPGPEQDPAGEREQGSIITLLATDLPLTARQLGRLAKRAQNGIARTGSITANGSGEIVIAFSTANRIRHYPDGTACGEQHAAASVEHLVSATYLHEDFMDEVFAAACDAVEESIISSLLHAKTTTDTCSKVHALSEFV